MKAEKQSRESPLDRAVEGWYPAYHTQNKRYNVLESIKRILKNFRYVVFVS